jgi:hypothetical protein
MGLVKARTRQEHVKLIAAAWQKGVESIIESGERIAAAKHELPHGEFEAMVEADLPFGPRTAQALMQISNHPVLSNAKYISHFPPAWGTLLKLAALPQTLLLAKIADGSITPKLGQNQVRTLLPPPEPKQRDDDLPPDYEGTNAPFPRMVWTSRLRLIPSSCGGLQPALRKGASSCARAGTRLCEPAIKPPSKIQW